MIDYADRARRALARVTGDATTVDSTTDTITVSTQDYSLTITSDHVAYSAAAAYTHRVPMGEDVRATSPAAAPTIPAMATALDRARSLAGRIYYTVGRLGAEGWCVERQPGGTYATTSGTAAVTISADGTVSSDDSAAALYVTTVLAG